MYVEHLFEGRTLDAETIELKEEIYGNLVARFDDYVAQGMDEQEAYARTCEAVSSVDDVLGTDGGRGGAAAQVDQTVVAEPVAAVPDAETAETATTPEGRTAAGRGIRERLGTGRLVAIVAAAVVVVLVGVALAVSALADGGDRDEAYDQTSIQAPTQGDTPSTDQTQDADSTAADADQGAGSGAQNGYGAQNGNGTQNGYGNGAQGQGAPSGTGVDAEIYAHDVGALSAYAGMPVDDDRLLQMIQSLPLGTYATSARADNGTVELSYSYEDRDLLAYDDDCVDRALVYDAAVTMAVMPDLATLRIVEEESSDHDYDRDLRVFERTTIERVLGTQLSPDLLTNGQWDGVRDKLMDERTWDAIWESAERD